MGGRPAVEETSERSMFGSAAMRDGGVSGLPYRLDPSVDIVEKQRAAVAQPQTGHLSRRVQRHPLQAAFATEWDRGTLFLFIPVLLASGALLYFTALEEPPASALIAGLLTLSALTFLARARLLLHLGFAAALMVVLGMTFAKVETEVAATKIIGGEITTRLTGRVVAIEHLANGRVRMTLDVVSTRRPMLRYAPDRVRVSARKIAPGIQAGSTIEGAVRLFPPSGPVRPQSYDFSFESYFDATGANGFFLTDPEATTSAIPPGPGASLLIWVENARLALASRIESRIGGAEGEIAAALVAGVRAGIPEDVNEALRKTGLAHVLSISGLHMVLVAATIMGALRATMALFPAFASRRPIKKYVAAVALIAISIYLLISGNAVAAQRSYIMLAVMLIALMFDRAALTMRNLAISAIVVIALAPHEVIGPSFQMSFAATVGLIGAYSGWTAYRQKKVVRRRQTDLPLALRLARKALLYAGGLAMTSLIAGTATTIFGAYHFQRISPLSLAANLAAMPAVSVLVMPFAVLGTALIPFGLDAIPFWIMGKGLTIMIAVAEWFSQRSPIDGVGIVPLGALLVMTAALILATLPTTWLRVACLPFIAVGAIMLGARTTPDVLVSEDGRLVAMRMANGTIAVNRSKPNAFAIENWQRALMATGIRKPEKLQASMPLDEWTLPPDESSFLCKDGLCMARHQSGLIIAHAGTIEAALNACAIANLVIIDDATASPTCANPDVAVVTKRQLARQGAAAIILASPETDSLIDVSYSISEPYRPWHDHRRFSREARGRPPYQPRLRQPDTQESRSHEAGNPEPSAPEINSGDECQNLSSAGSGRPACPEP